jgi:hypothetical protein
MPISEFSFIHPIRRLLQAYLPFGKRFWVFLAQDG